MADGVLAITPVAKSFPKLGLQLCIGQSPEGNGGTTRSPVS